MKPEIKKLRGLSRILRAQRLVPPFYREITPEEIPGLAALVGYVPARDFDFDHVGAPPEKMRYVGACEEFRFILLDRRRGQTGRRKSPTLSRIDPAQLSARSARNGK